MQFIQSYNSSQFKQSIQCLSQWNAEPKKKRRHECNKCNWLCRASHCVYSGGPLKGSPEKQAAKSFLVPLWLCSLLVYVICLIVWYSLSSFLRTTLRLWCFPEVFLLTLISWKNWNSPRLQFLVSVFWRKIGNSLEEEKANNCIKCTSEHSEQSQEACSWKLQLFEFSSFCFVGFH